MRQKLVGHDFAIGAELGDGIGNIGRVPVDDGSDDQVESGGTELLGLVGPVGDRLKDTGSRLEISSGSGWTAAPVKVGPTLAGAWCVISCACRRSLFDWTSNS